MDKARKYHYLLVRVDYPKERGYRMEPRKLPDYLHFTITEDFNGKYLTVYSRLHKTKEVRVGPTYTNEFTDREIIIDLSANIAYRFGINS